jgi:hypothetical protein
MCYKNTEFKQTAVTKHLLVIRFTVYIYLFVNLSRKMAKCQRTYLPFWKHLGPKQKRRSVPRLVILGFNFLTHTGVCMCVCIYIYVHIYTYTHSLQENCLFALHINMRENIRVARLILNPGTRRKHVVSCAYRALGFLRKSQWDAGWHP